MLLQPNSVVVKDLKEAPSIANHCPRRSQMTPSTLGLKENELRRTRPSSISREFGLETGPIKDCVVSQQVLVLQDFSNKDSKSPRGGPIPGWLHSGGRVGPDGACRPSR
jgi:hypothetical protein